MIIEGRRSFLRACLGFFVFPRPLYSSLSQRLLRTSDLASSLTHLFSHRESAIVVGLEYLQYRPGEADVDRLVDLICLCRPERRAELARAKVERLREVLKLQQREDFRYSRIVKVHGWILSETEARLCALVALT
jgi:hypothetical protein